MKAESSDNLGATPRTPDAVSLSIAQNHSLRSEHMRQLILNASGEPETLRHTGSSPTTPRVILQYWNDSDNIPVDVQRCIATWANLKVHGFKHLVFDDVSAAVFISEKMEDRHAQAFRRCVHPAMRCDYFRLCYLTNRGGMYVDADDVYEGGSLDALFADNTLKLQPFCFDLDTGEMADAFASANNGQDSHKKVFYVNNNPIISPPAHPVLLMALEQATCSLIDATPSKDIQSLTGPGNLTSSLVKHSITHARRGIHTDFKLVQEMDQIARTIWSLEYRQDDRNWRIWSGHDE